MKKIVTRSWLFREHEILEIFAKHLGLPADAKLSYRTMGDGAPGQMAVIDGGKLCVQFVEIEQEDGE